MGFILSDSVVKYICNSVSLSFLSYHSVHFCGNLMLSHLLCLTVTIFRFADLIKSSDHKLLEFINLKKTNPH